MLIYLILLRNQRQLAHAFRFFSPVDFVTAFGVSDHRKKLLQGFFKYRRFLRSFRVWGNQWISGSFVEDCMRLRGREPGDIDIVTFLDQASLPPPGHRLHMGFRNIVSGEFRKRVKEKYHCDAFFSVAIFNSPLNGPAGSQAASDDVRYWCNLFGHSRPIGDSGPKWKGMVWMPLAYTPDEQVAIKLLQKKGGGS